MQRQLYVPITVGTAVGKNRYLISLVLIPALSTLEKEAEPVFVDVYGHLGIDSKNRFRMKN
jgi:hypothetical protein